MSTPLRFEKTPNDYVLDIFRDGREIGFLDFHEMPKVILYGEAPSLSIDEMRQIISMYENQTALIAQRESASNSITNISIRDTK